jgi:hypothetical protein
LYAVLTAAGLAPVQIDVIENRAHLEFPDKITFRLTAKSTTDIERLSLLYGIESRTCQSGSVRRALEIEPGRDVEAEWEWFLADSGALPQGARVWWQWEIADGSGDQMITPQEWVTIRDDRYRWQSASSGPVTVEWSAGDQAFGRAILSQTLASLDRVSREIGLAAEAGVRVVIYPSAGEVQGALIHAPNWAGGVAFSEFNTVVIGVNPDQLGWAAVAIPHELTHLLVGARVFNCQGVGLPVWLHEGLAVYGEGPSAGRDRVELLNALDSGRLGALHTLADGFQDSGNLAELSYQYSGEVVGYLLATHGHEKLLRLLDTVKAGRRIEPALVEVYGFDTDGLDAAWRESVGLDTAPLSPDSGVTAAATRTPVPTFALASLSPTPAAIATLQPTAAQTAGPAVTPIPTPMPSAAPAASLTPTLFVIGAGLAGGAGLTLLGIGLLVFVSRKRS